MVCGTIALYSVNVAYVTKYTSVGQYTGVDC